MFRVLKLLFKCTVINFENNSNDISPFKKIFSRKIIHVNLFTK